jgi:hypothetical protein
MERRYTKSIPFLFTLLTIWFFYSQSGSPTNTDAAVKKGFAEARATISASASIPSYSIKAKHRSTATAKCRDGRLSFSLSRRGTCSWHGGVAIWY